MDLEYLKLHWRKVRAGLETTIEKFNDDELDYQPYLGAWSVRELILHIAQEELGEFQYGVLQTIREFPPEYNPRLYPTRRACKSLLKEVHGVTLSFLDRLEDKDLAETITTPWGERYKLIEVFGHLIEHEIHHRGELSLILGILGRDGFDA